MEYRRIRVVFGFESHKFNIYQMKVLLTLVFLSLMAVTGAINASNGVPFNWLINLSISTLGTWAYRLLLVNIFGMK